MFRLTNNNRWFFIQLYQWLPSILQVIKSNIWGSARDLKSLGSNPVRVRVPASAPRNCRWYTKVVSLGVQVMRFPSELSAFLELTAVSPRERHPSNCPLFLQAFLAKLSNCTESLTVDVRYLAFSIADNASFF
jgi:hypothetical protein